MFNVSNCKNSCIYVYCQQLQEQLYLCLLLATARTVASMFSFSNCDNSCIFIYRQQLQEQFRWERGRWRWPVGPKPAGRCRVRRGCARCAGRSGGTWTGRASREVESRVWKSPSPRTVLSGSKRRCVDLMINDCLSLICCVWLGAGATFDWILVDNSKLIKFNW